MIVEFTHSDWRLFLKEYGPPHKVKSFFPYIFIKHVVDGDIYTVDMDENVAKEFESEKIKLILKYG